MLENTWRELQMLISLASCSNELKAEIERKASQYAHERAMLAYETMRQSQATREITESWEK